MKIRPTLKEVEELAAEGKYKTVPLSCEILSDFITPIEAMRILKNVSSHCFMLESAQADEKWGRYTFLGYDPLTSVTCSRGRMKIGDVEDTEDFKDVDLMLFDKVIAFDNLRQVIVLIADMQLAEGETGYNKAALELKHMAELLREGKKIREPAGRLKGPVTPLFDRKRYCDMVERAKAHIREGDIFQIVLSNRLSAPFEGSLLNAYRVLRTINPSPYMFYLSGTDVEVAGASPETLVRLDGGVLHTFPLAGTRPRATECRSTSAWWRAWSGSTSSREGWTRVTCAPPYAGCRPMPWTSARG